MRQFVVNEDDLRRLLRNSYELEALWAAGVDNWSGYDDEEYDCDYNQSAQDDIDNGAFPELVHFEGFLE